MTEERRSKTTGMCDCEGEELGRGLGLNRIDDGAEEGVEY